jgi:hypothetical protein
MTENDLYSVTLCQEDWVRVVQALRNEAYALTQDSNRAHENGAIDYSTLLCVETAIHNAIADEIDLVLPE